MFFTACYTDRTTGEHTPVIVRDWKRLQDLIATVASDDNLDFLALALHKDDADIAYYKKYGYTEI